MKKIIALLLAVLVLALAGCQSAGPELECQSDPSTIPSISQTDSAESAKPTVIPEEGPEFQLPESVSQTDSSQKNDTSPTASKAPEESFPDEMSSPSDSSSTSPTDPFEGNGSSKPGPSQTHPPATEQPAPSEPKESVPSATDPTVPQPPQTEPGEPKATDPAVTEITYEFKRQIAAYAAQYINQYRGTQCIVLPGMSLVAQYRAVQLCDNFSHSTADKRAALAYYQYGRYVDATEFGDDPSKSYYEADSAEAICAGFYGVDPEAMGKKIADMIHNSSGHWSYIGSSEYNYIGVGVEYREGSEYGWYCCVMVGSVNYG